MFSLTFHDLELARANWNGRLDDGLMMKLLVAICCCGRVFPECYWHLINMSIYRFLLVDNYFNVFTVQVAKTIKLICMGNSPITVYHWLCLFYFSVKMAIFAICNWLKIYNCHQCRKSGSRMEIFRSKKLPNCNNCASTTSTGNRDCESALICCSGFIGKNSYVENS